MNRRPVASAFAAAYRVRWCCCSALRKGWPKWAAVLLTMVAAFTILLVPVGGIALSIAQLVAALPHYSDRVSDLSNEVLHRLSDWGVSTGRHHPCADRFAACLAGRLTVPLQ